jgi:PHD/YefM family antitoxin component YafN of YafNO toxin-antitoxin module
MEIFTVQEFQERWDELITRVEEGETFGIVNEDGESSVIMSVNDPLYKIYTENNNEAQ